MNLVQVTQESIAIGQPLPFALRDESGILLARKGYTIVARDDLDAMRWRGIELETHGMQLILGR